MGMEAKTLDIIHHCSQAVDFGGIESIVALLQHEVGIDGCILGFKEQYETCLVENSFITSFGISSEWLQVYKRCRLDALDPVAQKAFTFQRPVPWKEAYRQASIDSRNFIALSQDFGLFDGMSCANKSNRFSHGATCVSVTSERYLSASQLNTLHYILPHLNEAIAQPKLWSFPQITPREKEVLDWVKIGKSSWEISMILSVSERTVKFHLSNVYQKLGVHCRVRAVARAIKLGIIDL